MRSFESSDATIAENANNIGRSYAGEIRKRAETLLNKSKLKSFTQTLLSSPDTNGQTALHYAARLGKLKLTKSLTTHSIPIDAADNLRKTPFRLAIENDESVISKCLLDRNANVNTQANDGTTALHYVVQARNNIEDVEDIGKFLIEQGIDISIRDQNGRQAHAYLTADEQKDWKEWKVDLTIPKLYKIINLDDLENNESLRTIVQILSKYFKQPKGRRRSHSSDSSESQRPHEESEESSEVTES